MNDKDKAAPAGELDRERGACVDWFREPEQAELRKSCAMGWAVYCFQAGAAYQRAQQPSAGVVMPERKDHETYYDADEYRKDGWSAYIDEFARLNGKEVGCE